MSDGVDMGKVKGNWKGKTTGQKAAFSMERQKSRSRKTVSRI
jgi:hypothetical protein